MKRTWKKLFISILTWVFIFLTLGTSTFAWFSLSDRVTASNVKIKIQSYSTYLLIAPTDDVAINKAYINNCEAAFISGGDERKRVIPTYYGDGSVLGTGSNAVTTEVGKWYSASSGSFYSSNQTVTNVRQISDGDLVNYILTYKVYVSFANESLDYTGKAKISFERVSGDNSLSVVVLVDTTNGTEQIALNSNNDTIYTAGDITLTSTDAYPITILAYIDGNAEHVYSEYYYAHGITGEFNIGFHIED